MSDSADAWLDIGEKSLTPATSASTAGPLTLPERVAQVEACWATLSLPQRTLLTALRENRFNLSRANRALGHARTSSSHRTWMQDPNYKRVFDLWRGDAASEALDRDRLLVRQDDIVETLLTPKPVLHQGIPVIHNGAILEEVEAGAASRANEVLLRAGGHMPKDGVVEVNLGVQVNEAPTLNIQVMPLPPDKAAKDQHVVIDAKFTEVPSEDGWLDT